MYDSPLSKEGVSFSWKRGIINAYLLVGAGFEPVRLHVAPEIYTIDFVGDETFDFINECSMK